MMETASKTTLDYSVDFPELPDASSMTSTSASAMASVWAAATQPAIKSSVITEAFKLTADERASRGFGKAFGTASEEQQKCNQIAQVTGTKIELNEAKDQSITILITGKQKNVEDARTRLVRELQTQATVKVEVPKEFHCFIIGRKGDKLRQLEQKFLCRIHMPALEEKSDTIRVVGPNEYILEAAKHIRGIGEEMAKQKTEELEIPRSFYPWIRGVNNEIVDALMHRTGAKVNIPPSQSHNETIIITGEREGVETAAAEIMAIYNQKKDTVVSVEVNVKKGQHRYIIGQRRSGLDEIFRETEVLVELPPEDSDSETIVLRGPKDKIGDAVGAVYQKASSTIALEIPYKNWMRRHLIGPKGETLKALVPNQDKLKIDFEDALIYIEGASEQVKQAQSQLNAEIKRLDSELCYDVMHVPPSLHRHIIGVKGAFVNKLKEEHDVQISIPNEASRSDEIRLEGRKENVEKVKAAIAEIVSKQEKKVAEEEEKRKKAVATQKEKAPTKGGAAAAEVVPPVDDPHTNIQVEVEQRFHKHFIIRGAEVLREIQNSCGHCQISFPKQEADDKMVTIRGPKSGVEAAKKRILEIVVELEAQTQIQLDVEIKHHRHFIVRGAEVLKEIQSQCGNVQISFPKQDSNDSTVTIKGHKDSVQKARARIEEIVADLDAQREIRLEIDPKHHRHFIIRSAEVLRKIQKQCGNVQISFPKQESRESAVTIKGHEQHVNAAKAKIEEIVADLEAQTQIQFDVDPKYHRHFIMRGAEVLREIQKQFGNCQISFPKQESGDAVVTIRGREDHVNGAKARIEEIVDDLFDQFDDSQYIVRREEPPPPKPEPKNIEIKNAPWQIDNPDHFPSIGNGGGAAAAVPVQAWGQRR